MEISFPRNLLRPARCDGECFGSAESAGGEQCCRFTGLWHLYCTGGPRIYSENSNYRLEIACLKLVDAVKQRCLESRIAGRAGFMMNLWRLPESATDIFLARWKAVQKTALSCRK